MSHPIFAPPLNNIWFDTQTQPPQNGQIVTTCIRDAAGTRNEQELKRQGNLWFLPDGSMYVYYTPTHWKP